MAAGKWENVRDASFRGVPFCLVDDEGSSGRRAIPRAYPKKEVGWTEDNGAVLGQQQIKAKVVGKNYLDQLNALLDALNTPGPGELVHPWFGMQTVQVGKVSHHLSNEESDVAHVSFEVFEAGDRLFPSATDNTGENVLTGIDAVNAALESGDWFGALDGLGDMVDTFLDDLESFVVGLPSIPDALNDWTDRVSRFKDMAGVIIAYPGRLVGELTDLTQRIGSVMREPPLALQVYEQLRGQWSGDRALLVATRSQPGEVSAVPGSVADGIIGFAGSIASGFLSPSASLQKNIADFRQVVMLMTLTGQTKAMLSAVYTTSDTALRAGDALAGELSTQAIFAVENNQRGLWRQLRDLRLAVITDTRIRAARLPEILHVIPTTTTSAALLAWRETGDTENRDAIVARNRLRDPSFIVAGRSVEVIS
ncbi:multidrug DMT transporter [Citrobacter freundii]|nr:multidrug DMT transporter [Citrobacter freundii]MBC6508291.1 multidrug DMT transporter [Citrobacter freundii]